MSKVVKIVTRILIPITGGIKGVAGAALTIAGIFTGNIGLITAGLSLTASTLSNKPKNKAVSPENVNRLRANIDPRTPRKTVVGITALATDIRDEEFTDSQTYFHRFIVCASHKVEAITEIWFDDKVAWTAAGGVQGEFAGYLTVATRTEGSAANAINISARMGTTRRYTGLAYVHLRYKLTGNDKKADSPFAQSITTRITIRGKAALFYDPRVDSTVDGGSGSQRADDQSTWAWDDDACRNPALALLFYLLGYRINGELAVGKGIPPARIDLASFAVAANICDEEVDDGDGGTEPRYRCDGVWSEGDSPTAVMDMIKATMNADLDDVDGKLRLTVFHNDLATPDADFTDADVLGAFAWEPAPPLDQTFNIVRGTFTDASDTSLYQQIDYPEVSIASPDGIDRIDPVDFPMVQSATQAQRLAQLRLARQQYGGGTFRADFQATAWAVQKNSVVALSFAAAWAGEKLFRVAEMDIRVDGVVPLTLREEHASIYGAPSLQAALDPIASTPFDPTLDPITGAIADLSVEIAGVSEIVITADYAGTITTALPKLQPYVLLEDGVDVSTEAAWAVSVIAGTMDASIGAATGVLSLDVDTGTLTSGTVRITAARNGVTKAKDVKVTKTGGTAPSGGSGGGTADSADINGQTASTTLVALGPVLSITTGSAGEAELRAGYEYGTTNSAGSYGMSARWYDVTGAPAAVGTEQASDSDFNPLVGQQGQGRCDEDLTGLSASTAYQFQLYMSTDGDANLRYVTGSCSAVGG